MTVSTFGNVFFRKMLLESTESNMLLEYETSIYTCVNYPHCGCSDTCFLPNVYLIPQTFRVQRNGFRCLGEDTRFHLCFVNKETIVMAQKAANKKGREILVKSKRNFFANRLLREQRWRSGESTCLPLM